MKGQNRMEQRLRAKLEALTKTQTKLAETAMERRDEANRQIARVNKAEGAAIVKVNREYGRTIAGIKKEATKQRAVEQILVERADKAVEKHALKLIAAHRALNAYIDSVVAAEVSLPVPHNGGVTP